MRRGRCGRSPERRRSSTSIDSAETPTHLCRLRHFGPERWSVAFYKYSDECYEPSFLESGQMVGTPEEGFDVGAVYLTE
jgi:hypothetical protein